MRCVVWAGLLLTGTLLCGCNGSDDEPKKKGSPDAAQKQRPLTPAEEQEVKAWLDALQRQVQVKKEMVDILKKVQSRGSMEGALAGLGKLNVRAEAVAQELRKLGPPSRVVQERVEESAVSVELVDLRQAELAEVRRILKLPHGEEFFQAVKGLDKAKSP